MYLFCSVISKTMCSVYILASCIHTHRNTNVEEYKTSEVTHIFINIYLRSNETQCGYNEHYQPYEDIINWPNFESGFQTNELCEMTGQNNVRTEKMKKKK